MFFFLDYSFLRHQPYLETPLYSNETYYDENQNPTRPDEGTNLAIPDEDRSQYLISKRTGSFEADVYDTAEDVKGRIKVCAGIVVFAAVVIVVSFHICKFYSC